MLNIQDLIQQIQGATASGGVVINIINTGTDFVQPVEDNVVAEEETYDFDFEIDDEVFVHHVRKDGEEVFVDGKVIEVGHDDFGPYTRVLGDNGKHYKAGTTLGEERKGTRIIRKN
jgi:hypothetical protein